VTSRENRSSEVKHYRRILPSTHAHCNSCPLLVRVPLSPHSLASLPPSVLFVYTDDHQNRRVGRGSGAHPSWGQRRRGWAKGVRGVFMEWVRKSGLKSLAPGAILKHASARMARATHWRSSAPPACSSAHRREILLADPGHLRTDTVGRSESTGQPPHGFTPASEQQRARVMTQTFCDTPSLLRIPSPPRFDMNFGSPTCAPNLPSIVVSRELRRIDPSRRRLLRLQRASSTGAGKNGTKVKEARGFVDAAANEQPDGRATCIAGAASRVCLQMGMLPDPTVLHPLVAPCKPHL